MLSEQFAALFGDLFASLFASLLAALLASLLCLGCGHCVGWLCFFQSLSFREWHVVMLHCSKHVESKSKSRSRNSGFHVLEIPFKRSRTSLSDNKKRKAREWPATDDRYRQHKWGADVATNRATEGRSWNAKYPDRDRGKKK